MSATTVFPEPYVPLQQAPHRYFTCQIRTDLAGGVILGLSEFEGQGVHQALEQGCPLGGCHGGDRART